MFNLYRPPQHRASYSYTAGSGAGYTGYTAPERNSRITPERERPPGSVRPVRARSEVPDWDTVRHLSTRPQPRQMPGPGRNPFITYNE